MGFKFITSKEIYCISLAETRPISKPPCAITQRLVTGQGPIWAKETSLSKGGWEAFFTSLPIISSDWDFLTENWDGSLLVSNFGTPLGNTETPSTKNNQTVIFLSFLNQKVFPIQGIFNGKGLVLG